MYNSMNIIEIRQAAEHRERNLPNHLDGYRSGPLVYSIQRALVHELHAYADVWISHECTIKGDDM